MGSLSSHMCRAAAATLTVQVLHDAFKDALYDPAHMAVLDRFDMHIAYLGSEDYATAVRQQYEAEHDAVRGLGLRPG